MKLGHHPGPPPFIVKSLHALEELIAGGGGRRRRLGTDVGAADDLMEGFGWISVGNERDVLDGVAAAGEGSNDGGLVPCAAESLVVAADLDFGPRTEGPAGGPPTARRFSSPSPP